MYKLTKETKETKYSKKYFVNKFIEHDDLYNKPLTKLYVTQDEFESLADIDVFVKFRQTNKDDKVGMFYGADVFIKD